MCNLISNILYPIWKYAHKEFTPPQHGVGWGGVGRGGIPYGYFNIGYKILDIYIYMFICILGENQCT